MAYEDRIIEIAKNLIVKIMATVWDPERPPQAILEDLSRDEVYSLKWVYEQAVAMVENDFENRPEED